jgi:hypothetical protein
MQLLKDWIVYARSVPAVTKERVAAMDQATARHVFNIYRTLQKAN